MPVITDVSFREKSRSDYDWQKFGFVLWGKSADKADQNSVLSSYMHKENPFVKAFLWDIILRTSCYACPAKGGTSRADITIADFWGIEDVFPEFADASGVGLAIVHTVNGEMHLSNSDILSKEASLAEAMIKNSVYNQSVQKPNSRAKFFTEFSKGSHVTSLLSNYAKASACCLFVKKLKTAVKKLMFR